MESFGRFSGTVKTHGKEFGYISLDDSNTDVWFHREVCDEGIATYDSIAVGDRLNFSIKESVNHPGELAAGRITREKDPGPKYHPPKSRATKHHREAAKRRKTTESYTKKQFDKLSQRVG
jgi:cold shock CspA family protein